MKVPYMREILFICIGLNTSFFFSSISMENSTGMWLALASGSMCVLGLVFNEKLNRDDK
jgi:hypothetical protein|tara:strand:+ start:507 stop:683 length:177 start_codon:yes stop_codon:yes gene_type:complete